MSETSDIVTPLIKTLNGDPTQPRKYPGIPGCYAYRIFCGRARVRGGVVHGAPTGTPDVGAVIAGKPVFFEAKLPGELPSGDQMDAHRALARAGARVHVVTSVREALDVVRDLLSS